MDGDGRDLAALRRGGDGAGPTADAAPVAPGRSPTLWLGVGLGLAAIAFAALTWERWLPATGVRAARVAAIPAAAEAATATAGGEARFQAAGWIEADPQPILVTGLVGGVVDEVLVLEGQAVEAGQVLARLDDADHRLVLAHAQAELATARAAAAAAEQAVIAAGAERERLVARLAAADARVAERRDLADRYGATSRAFAELERSQAQLALATAEAERTALAAEAPSLAAAEARAKAEVERLQALAEVAAVALRRAELDLERTEIRAPVAGIVARLLAVPGRKQMLHADNPHSTTVAELFDPEHLQARIDVALGDAAGLAIGQPVELRTEALPDEVFLGRVARIVGEADIARNTVQVKVRLERTHPVLRPGVLVRARFMGTASADVETAAAGGLRLVVPAVAGAANESRELWVVGEGDRAASRAVRFGAAVDGGGITVRDGLGAGELVVLDPPTDLADGDRLAVEEVVE